MAKFHGILIPSAAASTVTIYRMRGKIYIRSKSTLSRKKVLKSASFANTRMYAGHMATASRIGSEIYAQVPKEKRRRSVYQAITGKAATMLYQGEEAQEVKAKLAKQFLK